jgi:hypothetical protein
MSTPRLTTTSMTCVLALTLGAGWGVVEGGASLLPCGPVAMLPGGGCCETSQGRNGDCCRTHVPEQPPLASRNQQRGGAKWLQQVRQTAWIAESFPPMHHAGERMSEWCPGSAWGTLQGLRVRLNI